jgi:hypothetical protein
MLRGLGARAPKNARRPPDIDVMGPPWRQLFDIIDGIREPPARIPARRCFLRHR